MTAPLISTLIVLLAQGSWREATSQLRAWYVVHCPRYNRRHVEEKLLWIASTLASRKIWLGKASLAPSMHLYMNASDARKSWEEEVKDYLLEEPLMYKRYCFLLDTLPPAEERIEVVLRRGETSEKGKR
jgi:hypothetical protein